MAKRNRQDLPSSARPSRDDPPASSPPAGVTARWWARPVVVAGVIFALLLAVYNLNGQFLYGNDAKPNVYLPAALLSGGAMSFTPSEYPFMFHWVYRGERAWESILFDRWDRPVPGHPFTFRQLLEAGSLKLYEPKYYLVPSTRSPVDGNPLFVNTFGPGAGLTALPVFAVLHLAVGGDLREHPAAMWYGAKVVASLLVAGSAAFVFLTARAFLATGPAALIALAYGLGTGVWSTSSQTLWQHGPNEFFLALGAYFLVRCERSWKRAAACGGALSAAVACRPTSVVVAAAVGVYLFARPLAARLPWPELWGAWRRTLLPYALAALPIAVLLASYNAYYLGSPWEFGQAKTGHQVALSKTGSSELWQTPLLTGAAGLMVSPSRGLLVFSPFMVFALAGLVRLWTRRRYAVLRPLAAGMTVLLVIAFKWFDWWGGWCYGPRPIVDTMPLFALMLIPVIGWICRHRAALVVFLVLAAWSAGVQALGALAYDMFGWNKGSIALVYVAGRSEPLIATSQRELDNLGRKYTILRVKDVSRDIDDPENRYRLWSLTDNQILFYLEKFDKARRTKAQYIEIWLKEPHR